MKISSAGLFLFSILLFTFCNPKTIPYTYDTSDQPIQNEETSEERAQDKFAEFSADSTKSIIFSYIDSIENFGLYKIKGEFIFSNNTLKEMYNSNGYALLWYDQKNRFDAIECLENSWTDGLEPGDYHLDQIKALRSILLSNTYLDYDEIAQFDLLLTDGLLLYAYHLIKGKVNPSTVELNWNFTSRTIPQNPTRLFEDAIQHHTITGTIAELRPQYEPYQLYRKELMRYQSIKDNGGWEKVNVTKVIKPYEYDAGLPSVRKRLFITGEIEFEEPFIDSLYDDDLINAVKKFQHQHGLNPDGVIGKNTLEALNIPVDQKINQIKVNMERARWVLSDLGSEMLLVNIANFKLFYFKDSSLVHETKVMVGTSFNQTPVFKSKMKYLVFNPTWTVPYSIATQEILPKLKKDSTYLSDKNMTLLNASGVAINQRSVDWSTVTPSNFYYTIREEPGPGNALGQVKFMFPNNYSVYLHDTPSKYLFAREDRAFSHGCIRVQSPLKLAEVLLNDTKWDQEKIKQVIDEKKETVVYLKKPIDILLLYWTCGFYDNKDVFFLKDIYNRDQKILEQLQNNDWEKLIPYYRKEISSSAG